MKKILIAFDNGHFSEGVFEMARHVNEIEPVHLADFFSPSVHYSNTPVGAGSIAQPFFAPLIEDENVNFIEESNMEFEEKCGENNIRYSIHKDLIDAASPPLRIETCFSDLLISGNEMFYKNLGKEKLNPSLKYAIHEAEHPVSVVPGKFEFPTSNILAYDGSETSVFAIKQFKFFSPEFIFLFSSCISKRSIAS